VLAGWFKCRHLFLNRKLLRLLRKSTLSIKKVWISKRGSETPRSEPLPTLYFCLQELVKVTVRRRCFRTVGAQPETTKQTHDKAVGRNTNLQIVTCSSRVKKLTSAFDYVCGYVPGSLDCRRCPIIKGTCPNSRRWAR
jgi:hypothetical protein